MYSKRVIFFMQDVMLDVFFESLNDDSVSYADFSLLGDMVTEGFMTRITKGPLGPFVDKIKQIKKEKPDKYSDNDYIKNFIDKNYDDIMKVVDILEEEPEKIQKKQVMFVVRTVLIVVLQIVGMVGMGVGGIVSMSTVAATASIGTNVGIASMIVFAISLFLPFINAGLTTFLTYLRDTTDINAYNEVIKIRDSLSLILKDKKNIPASLKIRIESLINKIDSGTLAYTRRIREIK